MSYQTHNIFLHLKILINMYALIWYFHIICFSSVPVMNFLGGGGERVAIFKHFLYISKYYQLISTILITFPKKFCVSLLKLKYTGEYLHSYEIPYSTLFNTYSKNIILNLIIISCFIMTNIYTKIHINCLDNCLE